MLMKNEKTDLKTLSIGSYKFYYTDIQDCPSTDTDFKIGNETFAPDYFLNKLVVDLADGTKRRYTSEDGTSVIRLLERVPIFDSGDSMYDSYKMLIIYPFKGRIHGIYLRGGYYLASAALCTDLVCADEKTKQMLEELTQMPANVQKD